jgi:hypothetical protein
MAGPDEAAELHGKSVAVVELKSECDSGGEEALPVVFLWDFCNKL